MIISNDLPMNKEFIKGIDCKELFKAAYENRYTWSQEFNGYKGDFAFQGEGSSISGTFFIPHDLKPTLQTSYEGRSKELVASQLWEVCIHRVRRSFEKVHGENTFTSGIEDDQGLEIIVAGKNEGDKYKVKNNIVTMVSRNIHNKLIHINTLETINTTNGYLSKKYTSQYSDPRTQKPISNKSLFTDIFVEISKSGIWVLQERIIETLGDNQLNKNKIKYTFSNLILL